MAIAKAEARTMYSLIIGSQLKWGVEWEKEDGCMVIAKALGVRTMAGLIIGSKLKWGIGVGEGRWCYGY